MIKTYSPNMLKTFLECPMKFRLRYVDNLSVPQVKTPFEKGKKIHALASYYLKKFDVTKLESVLSVEEAKIWQNLKKCEYFTKELVGCEYNLSCKVDKYWVGGRIDALVKSGEDYIILDYKTGGVPRDAQNDPQTLVYLLCVAKKVKKFNSLKFVYIDLKHNSEASFEYSGKEEEIIKNICDKIDNAVKHENFKKACTDCEYKKICEGI